jgi:hypothetical protein
MSHHYVTEADASSPYTLPNIWVAQFTAHEVAEGMEDEIRQYSRMPQHRLASMNSTVRERMLEVIISDLEIRGGFMWCVCFPGCLPDSEWNGPFPTYAEALADAREQLAED